MSHLLLKILGVRDLETQDIASWSLEFHGANLGMLLLTGLALTALTIFLYRRVSAELPVWLRYTLTGLRVTLFILLLALILQPVLQLGINGKVRQSFVVLLDGTTSMRIQDLRIADADLKRAGIATGALDPRAGLGQPLEKTHEFAGISREALLKAVLQNPQLDLLKKLNTEFDLIFYSFGKELMELPSDWSGQYQANSPVTALGDAVREILRRQRGQSVAGAFVLTDGGNNSGSLPLDAATLAWQEKFPLYIYGIGLTSPKDIIVESIFSEDVAFVKDELTVTVRVRSQGLAGEKAVVVLKLGEQPVGEQEIILENDAEQVVEMKFTPQQTGEFDLQASIAPRPDETVKDNNSQTKRLRVVDTKMNVLLIEQSPRWEFRYLLAMLLRDRRMNVKTLLFEADPGLAQAENSPYLAEFPKQKEDLFKYDVILLGDVDPKLFSAEQQETLRDYVSKFGGALVMIAGKRFSPQAYARTPLEAALPVEIPKNHEDNDVLAGRPITLELTAAGKESPILALSDQAEESLKIWRELPPLYWVAHIAGVRPAASVLLTALDAPAGGHEKLPVIVFQKYGVGQTLFVGTDATWRWRKNIGDKYFTLLWSQVVQRMALSRLLGEAKRTQLSSDRQSYFTGDRVTVYARLYTASYDPVNDAQVIGRYTARGGKAAENLGEREVTLRPLPGQPGMYRGEFVAPVAGAYKFAVDRDAETELDFAVQQPKFELGQTAMNEPLLKEMAAVSGGAFLREEDLYRLPELVNKKVEMVRSYIEVEVWSSPLVFTLFVLVTGLEWALRKKFQLK